MKKLLAVVVILALVAAGGAVYWKFGRQADALITARRLMARNDLRAAQIELRKAVRDNPKNGEAHWRLGSVQLQLGDPVAAEKELKEARTAGYPAVSVVPPLARSYLAQNKLKELLAEFTGDDLPPAEHASVLISRGLAQIGLKDIDAASASLDAAQKLAPDNVDAAIAQARVAALRNDPDTALAQLDHAIKIAPDTVDAWLFRAAIERTLGKNDLSLAALDKAVELAPTNTNIRLQRTSVYLSENMNDKAAADVAIVLKAEPKNPVAIYFSAVLDVRAAKWQDANTKLSLIPTALPRLQRGEYFLALVKANVNQLEQAADAAQRYVARNKTDPAGYKLLARIDGMAGRTNELVDVLKRGVEAGVGDAEMLEMLGGAYNQTGQLKLGLLNLEKAAALAPENPEILSRLATTKLGLGDAEGAQMDLDHSLKISPDRVEASEALVVAALSAGDVAKADTTLGLLIKNDKIAPAVLGNLTGLVKLAELDLDGARDAWRKVVEITPDALPPRLNLARVLTMQGQYDAAVQVLMPILTKDPTNAQALGGAATALTAQGKGAEVTKLLEAARRAAPDNMDFVAAEAEYQARGGDLVGALALLDGVMKDNKSPAPVLLAERGRLLIGLKRTADAIENYLELVNATPKDFDSRRVLIDLQLGDKQNNAAVAQAKAGLAAQPGLPSMMQTYVRAIYRAQGLEAAQAACDLLVRDPNNLPSARTLKGGLLMSLKRYKEAALAYQQQFTVAPSGPLAALTATALAADGRPDEATKLLTDYLKTTPDPDAEQILAALQISARQFDDAVLSLQALLKLRPNDSAALNNLAWIESQRKDPHAQVLAQKSYMLTPSPQSADTLGWILTNQGKVDTGVVLLRQAAGQLPNDGTIQFHYAKALALSGERAKALEVINAQLARPGEFDEKADARQLQQELAGKPGGK